MAKWTEPLKDAQLRHERKKRAAGEHIKIGLTLKTAEDRAMFRALQERFPGERNGTLTRRGLRALHEITCEEGVYDLKGNRIDED